MILAILCEAGSFGNPFPFSEQQYYLYGGGQILQHQLPYLDFWDRKPVGLFLLFAPLHLFGAERFYALPLLAAFFSWGGALCLAAIARLLSSSYVNAFLAGAVYLIGSNAFPDETGGQAEQFYIPLILFAVWLLLRAFEKIQKNLPDLFKTGLMVMALLGVAMEIKTSCAWDGVFLGCALLVLLLQLPALPPCKKALWFFLCTAVWIFAAMLPTLLIMAYYALKGHLYDWIWANILNHHLRSKAIGHTTAFFASGHYYKTYLKHALETVILWGLPALYVGAGLCFNAFKALKANFKPSLPPLTPEIFLFIWSLVSLVASIQLRGGYQAHHYTIAAIPAAVLLGALLAEHGKWQKFFLLWPLLYVTPHALNTNLTAHQDEIQLQAKVSALLNQQHGCLFQLSGGSLFYDLSPATSRCRVTKFLLPGMLTSPEEQFALGIDREAEILRVLRLSPLYLVVDAYDPRLSCASPFKNQVEIKDGLWATSAIDPQKRHAIQEIITQNYLPLFEAKQNKQGSDYVFYKLKPSLTPQIVPFGIKERPSKVSSIPKA